MRVAFLVRPPSAIFQGLGLARFLRAAGALFCYTYPQPAGRVAPMDEKLVDFLWEEITRLDDAIVDLGDALDVKASIVLVLATLLGAISGPILALHELPPWVKVAHAIAVAGLGFTVICALTALWPSEFTLPPHVEAW